MSTEHPRNGYAEASIDWPHAPASTRSEGEATTICGGDDGDGEQTTPTGPVAPTSRPRPQPGPSAQLPDVGPSVPRPWTLGPTTPTRPPPPHRGVETGLRRQHTYPSVPPRYPLSQGLSQSWGHPAPPAFDPRPASRRTWYLVGGAVAVVVGIAIAAVLLTRGGDTATGAASSQAADGTLVPVTPSVSAPPPRSVPVHVDAAHLPQLLLPADAVSTVLASPGMIAGPVQSSVAPGAESVITPIECTSTWSAGKTWTYQASGFLGMARQDVAEKPTPTHAIVQAVIAFPDAAAAHASYAVQVKAWGTCQFRTVTAHLPGAPKDQTAAIGGFTEADGVAVLQTTPDIGLPGVVCQRALTVAGNVVADVRSCSPNVADTGKTVARHIAAKVTSGR